MQVTTFSVCPCPVAVGVAPGAASSAGSGGFSGQADAAVAMLAGVTTAGTVELVTLQRGLLQPLHASISASIGEHNLITTPYTSHAIDVCREYIRPRTGLVLVPFPASVKVSEMAPCSEACCSPFMPPSQLP